MKPDRPQKTPPPPRQEIEVLDGFVTMAVAKPENLNLENPRNFLMNPPPRGKLVQCTIIRDKSGLAKKMCPEYHVYLCGTDIHIMSAKKTGWMKSSNYFIGYEKKNFDRGASHLVAKVKSNFKGTQFNIFDIGLNPSKTKDNSKLRCELGVVLYVRGCLT